VNIDAEVRQTIERRLTAAPVNLLDAAHRQIYLLMKYDPYPRFLRSRFYWDAVNAERLNKRLDVPATDNTTSRRAGSSFLSRLRQRWKGTRASKSTPAKDDSGHGTSLSSLGSDGGNAEHSRSSVDSVTPSNLLNRFMRRLSSSKSTRREYSSESLSAAATPRSVPAARRSLFFDRCRRSTDVADDDDARSVSTVASSRTTAELIDRRRSASSDTRRRLSAPLSHVVRCDAEQRRRFIAVMSRIAADRRAPTATHSDIDGHRRCDSIDVDDRLRLAVSKEVRQRRRRRHRGTASECVDSNIEFTVYFV